MLQALDFLAHNEIIHGDVKPANILHTRSKNGHVFRLGICNHASQAVTCIKTPIYEMFCTGSPANIKG